MPKKKILVVDDSKVALMTQKMLLSRSGDFEVIEAKDGSEAVESAERELPDLILMDVNMPIMTGFEACREIRSREATKKIPVILVTTRGETEKVQEGFAAGCTDYVTKPVDSNELIEKLKTLLGES